jgi:hypothetical protein
MRWSAALPALLVLLSPRTARPDEPPHVRLEYAAPKVQDCQREDLFRAMLRGLLRAPLLDPSADRVLSVRIDPRPAGGFHVRLAIIGADGKLVEERQGDYPPMCCVAAVYFAAVLSATMIAPPQAEEPQPAPPPPPPVCPACEVCSAPPPPPPPPAASRPALRPTPKATPPKAKRLQFRGVVGLLYGSNVSPADAPGAQLGVQVRGPWWSVELDGRYTFEAMTAFKVDRIDTYTLGGALAPCFRFDPFAACAVLAGGILRATTQLPNSFADAGLFLSLGGRLTVEVPLPVRFVWPLALRFDAEAAGTVMPPDLRSLWGTAFWTGRAVTWHGGASLVVTF